MFEMYAALGICRVFLILPRYPVLLSDLTMKGLLNYMGGGFEGKYIYILIFRFNNLTQFFKLNSVFNKLRNSFRQPYELSFANLYTVQRNECS